jgi:excisionase family DNA binding protein
MLQEELEREKERLFLGLTPREKREVFRVLSKQYNIPEFITVKDVSEFLGITPQMVRRHCSDGRIKALQTLEGSGKWRIQSEQFMDHPDWDKFLEKRGKIKKQSINIAEKMMEYLDDVE